MPTLETGPARRRTITARTTPASPALHVESQPTHVARAPGLMDLHRAGAGTVARAATLFPQPVLIPQHTALDRIIVAPSLGIRDTRHAGVGQGPRTIFAWTFQPQYNPHSFPSGSIVGKPQNRSPLLSAGYTSPKAIVTRTRNPTAPPNIEVRNPIVGKPIGAGRPGIIGAGSLPQKAFTANEQIPRIPPQPKKPAAIVAKPATGVGWPVMRPAPRATIVSGVIPRITPMPSTAKGIVVPARNEFSLLGPKAHALLLASRPGPNAVITSFRPIIVERPNRRLVLAGIAPKAIVTQSEFIRPVLMRPIAAKVGNRPPHPLVQAIHGIQTLVGVKPLPPHAAIGSPERRLAKLLAGHAQAVRTTPTSILNPTPSIIARRSERPRKLWLPLSCRTALPVVKPTIPVVIHGRATPLPPRFAIHIATPPLPTLPPLRQTRPLPPIGLAARPPEPRRAIIQRRVNRDPVYPVRPVAGHPTRPLPPPVPAKAIRIAAATVYPIPRAIIVPSFPLSPVRVKPLPGRHTATQLPSVRNGTAPPRCMVLTLLLLVRPNPRPGVLVRTPYVAAPLPPDLPAAIMLWLRQSPQIVAKFGDSLTTPKFFGDRATWNKLPDMPYLVYDEIYEGNPTYESADQFGVVHETPTGQFQIAIFTKNKIDGRNLARMIKNRLNDAPLFFQDGWLLELRWESELSIPGDGTIGPGSAPTYYQRVMTFLYCVEREMIQPT